MADDEKFPLEVGYDLMMKIDNWHAEHPDEPLVLTPAEVCELEGCALGGERHG